MEKYDLIPQQLVYEGTLEPQHFFEPGVLPWEVAALVHTPEYIGHLQRLTLPRADARRIGFPFSDALVHRERVITQGTLDCAEWALHHGCALNVAGGTHHAYANRGEGYCLLNDQAVAAAWLLHTGRACRIAIIDLDVHQGQGTALIFAHEPRVFTFSMHAQANYPLHKERSDWDIALPSHTLDGPYLDALALALPQVADRHRPDFVFYQAGADPLATDKLGHLALTPHGLAQRDALVLDWAQALGAPVVVCMGGGYSPRLADVVNAHCATFRQAAQRWG
jgi:acetoin utilization deacetylase AcuC-like enzyme